MKNESVIAAVSSLKNWEKNPRIITREAIDRLKILIAGDKMLKPMIVEDDGTVLGGNARLMALRELGETEAWVSIVHPQNDQERIEIALLDNDHVGVTDKSKLMPLISTMTPETLSLFTVRFSEGSTLETIQRKFSPDGAEPPAAYANIEKIVLPFTNEEFEEALQILEIFMTKFEITNHTEAVTRLLESYA